MLEDVKGISKQVAKPVPIRSGAGTTALGSFTTALVLIVGWNSEICETGKCIVVVDEPLE